MGRPAHDCYPNREHCEINPYIPFMRPILVERHSLIGQKQLQSPPETWYRQFAFFLCGRTIRQNGHLFGYSSMGLLQYRSNNGSMLSLLGSVVSFRDGEGPLSPPASVSESAVLDGLRAARRRFSPVGYCW
jgi:hypothetical protein